MGQEAVAAAVPAAAFAFLVLYVAVGATRDSLARRRERILAGRRLVQRARLSCQCTVDSVMVEQADGRFARKPLKPLPETPGSVAAEEERFGKYVDNIARTEGDH